MFMQMCFALALGVASMGSLVFAAIHGHAKHANREIKLDRTPQ
jgi:hypothetical protein